MSRPSSRNLSHDYEAYKGLSLRELFLIVLICTPATALLFTLLGACLDFPVALGCTGFLVGFVLSITVCPKHMARIKQGKPYGYLMKKSLLLLVRAGFRQSPYIHHIGRWNKSATRRSSHV